MSQSTPSPSAAAMDDASGGSRAFVIIVTIGSITTISLRFWSRSIQRAPDGLGSSHVSRFWWDDWAALAAMPFILGLCGIIFAMLYHGLGHHIQFVPPDKVAIFLRLLYALYYMYNFGLFFTKCSALLFLSRIFSWHANTRCFNYAIATTHVLNAAWLLGVTFGTVFMCNPVEKGWSQPLSCGPTSALWISSAVPSACIDFIILVLPLPKIWTLKMTRARKVGVTGIFVLGYW
ncbi:hypothetical protein H634G_09746 [Metarhizium anisopliae BRIP 53293]|uniref:Rhodopsin domain-containing protein n=1 Tax=Metarhizium anisopliae BRIP 53293 TaxID=1291518 RepID=A0A0D9NLE9_METAN|nr:hypothetical protein H634G_09746 [Metarhizium anisopliae BRIP 53293]KJK93627.1 hypothetical protein H633G_02505 [Metarhizium anisopliae BRIP 53284]